MATLFGPGALGVPLFPAEPRTKKVDGVAPPGWKHSVERMKQHGDITNPFALAWWLKNRGAKPARHETDTESASDPLTAHLVAQQHSIPPVCLAAARGEAWAQAQLLDAQCPPLTVGGRW